MIATLVFVDVIPECVEAFKEITFKEFGVISKETSLKVGSFFSTPILNVYSKPIFSSKINNSGENIKVFHFS